MQWWSLEAVSRRTWAVGLASGVQRQGRVGVGAARAHLCGHPDRLHEFVFAGSLSQGDLVWAWMQYGHWVTCATATAMICFVFSSSAPSANTCRLNSWKAAWVSGANCLRRSAIWALGGG
jgi:hypothetical protein